MRTLIFLDKNILLASGDVIKPEGHCGLFPHVTSLNTISFRVVVTWRINCFFIGGKFVGMMQRKASRDSRSLWTGSKSVGTLKNAKESRCHIAGVQEVGGYEGGVDCEEDSYYEVNSHKSSSKQEGKRHVQDLYVNIPVHTTNNYRGNPSKNFEVESYKEDKGEEEYDKAQHGASSQVQMRPDLAEISFEDLQKLRERVGIRRYERMAFKQLRNTGKKKIPKRINKNRPVEISAKQPVSVLRQVASVKKQVLMVLR
uniref:Uncharacterized protein n=2 Tax=Eptatretus burgeri TaxID=7764 RepID=A0A8C4R9C3_EPTBU